jgi:hypothetical protein
MALVAALLLSACAPGSSSSNSSPTSWQPRASRLKPTSTSPATPPFYLKLSESVLRPQPQHAGLAAAVAGGFTQYAYAFVAFEADRLDATDARAAQQLRARAARLYQRGRDHALAALEARQPGFAAALAQPDSALRLAADDTPRLLGAAAWGGLISLSKDSPDTVADLPWPSASPSSPGTPTPLLATETWPA